MLGCARVLIGLLLYYINFNVGVVISNERQGSCQTQNGLIGRCTPIENCRFIRREINKGNTVVTICHLQHSQVFVCCPAQWENIVTPDEQSTYPNSLNVIPPPPTVPQTPGTVPKSAGVDTPSPSPATFVTQAPSSSVALPTTAATTANALPTAAPAATGVTTICIPVESTTAVPMGTSSPEAKDQHSSPDTPPPKADPGITENPSESDNLGPKTEPPTTMADPDSVVVDANTEVEDLNPNMRIKDNDLPSGSRPPGSKIVNEEFEVDILDRGGDALFQKKCEDYYTTKSGKVQVSVIGGTNSSPREFPHMAALGFGEESDKKWLCGGSLVSENYVLTAAHCVSANSVGDVKFVRLGTINLQNPSDSVEDYNVVSRLRHPEFNGNDQYNDIALLQLDRSVQFSENVFPVCLHSLNDLDHHTLIASGWGKTDLHAGGSSDLKKVGLELFSNMECRESYKSISQQSLPRGIDEETLICAGSRTDRKDTCQGDSGGPLQFRSKGRLYLVGITSFGIGCGTTNSPGVYTRVSHYITWIERTIWKQK